MARVPVRADSPYPQDKRAVDRLRHVDEDALAALAAEKIKPHLPGA